MLKLSLKLTLETQKMRPILQFLIFLLFFFWGGGRQKGILHIIKKSHGTALFVCLLWLLLGWLSVERINWLMNYIQF